MNGYTGRILTLNVSDGSTRIDPIDDAFARTWLGANGFAVKLLHDRLPPGTDPLSPDNLVVFSVGPVTDVVPGSSRAYVASKSPLTGLFCDSTFGGRFAITQKRTGFEAIAITGKSDRLVVVVVDQNGATIRDAAHLRGKTTLDTARSLQAEFGDSADVAAIGQAGENLVLYACIANFWKERQGIAGRGGLGAVLGAKNVKAVVVTGKRKTQLADRDALRSFIRDRRPAMLQKAEALTKFGTPVLTEMINKMGGLAARNAQREFTSDVSSAGTQAFHALYQKRSACFGCPVACGHLAALASGDYAGTAWKAPEYETIYALGAMLDCFDAPFLLRANQLSDELGLDTISLGVTLAFAAECLEKKLLSPRDLGCDQLFNNPSAILRLIQDTAANKGFGARLAQGAARLAAHVGRNSHSFLYAVKNLEIAGHSPRALKGMGLGYAVSSRGGSHHDTRPTTMYPADHDNTSTTGQAQLSFDSQNATAVGDSLTLCRFVSERLLGTRIDDAWAHLLRSVTGWDINASEVQTIGERIYNMERIFNLREGLTSDQDTLPRRVLHEPLPDGPLAGARCSPEELHEMRSTFYQIRGWDPEGVPTRKTLDRLGLANTCRK